MERLELKLENSDIKLEDKIILTFMKDPDIVDKDEKFFNIKSSLFLSNITYTGNDVGVVFNEHEVCIKYPKHHFYKYLCNKLIEYKAESKKKH